MRTTRSPLGQNPQSSMKQIDAAIHGGHGMTSRWLWGAGLMGTLVCVFLAWRWWPQESRADAFAQDRVPAPAHQVPFDSQRALKDLSAICAIGTRVSGSPGMQKQQEMLEKHFKAQGLDVSFQRFQATRKSTRTTVEMANLIARINPEKQNRIILCTHYDTRPRADQETDRAKRDAPFLSANDGGSGVAFLMELARHAKSIKCVYGIDLVCFDGEEFVLDQEDDYFHGSRHFATRARLDAQRGIRYRCAVLLDMIAGKNPRFPIEQNSWFKAPRLVEEIYTTAIELKATSFQANKYSSTPVEDDHVPLNNGGIPAIDLIDFDYPHWHKMSDTPENCAPEGLDQVSRVLVAWMDRIR